MLDAADDLEFEMEHHYQVDRGVGVSGKIDMVRASDLRVETKVVGCSAVCSFYPPLKHVIGAPGGLSFMSRSDDYLHHAAAVICVPSLVGPRNFAIGTGPRTYLGTAHCNEEN